MESIVILADSAAGSRTALDYGYALAAEKQLPVALVYVYDVPLLYAPDAFSGTFLPVEEAHRIAAETLQALADTYAKHFPQVPVSTHLALMEPEMVLNENQQTPNNSLIVIGIDPSSINDWWEDHRGLDTLRESRHSVLAVQTGYTYHPVRRVMLALRSDQAVDTFPLAQLQSVLTLTGASLQVVTVNAKSALSPELVAALEPLGATYHEVTSSEDVDATLARLVAENPIDWLAVVPGEYGFWAGLFHKSHTLALAEHSSVPLLALHLPEVDKK